MLQNALPKFYKPRIWGGAHSKSNKISPPGDPDDVIDGGDVEKGCMGIEEGIEALGLRVVNVILL